MALSASLSRGSYKACHTYALSKDASGIRSTPLFRNLRELHKVDKRRVHDSLKRLVKRGLVQSFGDGRYRLRPDLRHAVKSYLSTSARARERRSYTSLLPDTTNIAKVIYSNLLSIPVVLDIELNSSGLNTLSL